MLVFKMFPHPFSAKYVVVELKGTVENVLHGKSKSKSKSAAVHQKETKLNEKADQLARLYHADVALIIRRNFLSDRLLFLEDHPLGIPIRLSKPCKFRTSGSNTSSQIRLFFSLLMEETLFRANKVPLKLGTTIYQIETLKVGTTLGYLETLWT